MQGRGPSILIQCPSGSFSFKAEPWPQLPAQAAWDPAGQPLPRLPGSPLDAPASPPAASSAQSLQPACGFQSSCCPLEVSSCNFSSQCGTAPEGRGSKGWEWLCSCTWHLWPTRTQSPARAHLGGSVCKQKDLSIRVALPLPLTSLSVKWEP